MKNKALLCGINYEGTPHALRGCINDVNNVRDYLGKQFSTVHDVHFTNQGISTVTTTGTGGEELWVVTLTDHGSTLHTPTGANIMHAIDWLVADTRPGDRRFFHYSGHGTHVPDQNGDELSGQDQALCPIDFRAGGLIIDDDLRKRLIDPLPHGAQLRAILDCCHSGSAGDLRFNYTDTTAFEKAYLENPNEALTRADVAIFSGCMDTQTSADALRNGTWAGALTSGFLEILRDPAQTDRSYRALFHRLTTTLADRKYTQRPQLSSGRPLSLDETFALF